MKITADEQETNRSGDVINDSGTGDDQQHSAATGQDDARSFAPLSEDDVRTSAPLSEDDVRTSAPLSESDVRTSAPLSEGDVRTSASLSHRSAEVDLQVTNSWSRAQPVFTIIDLKIIFWARYPRSYIVWKVYTNLGLREFSTKTSRTMWDDVNMLDHANECVVYIDDVGSDVGKGDRNPETCVVRRPRDGQSYSGHQSQVGFMPKAQSVLDQMFCSDLSHAVVVTSRHIVSLLPWTSSVQSRDPQSELSLMYRDFSIIQEALTYHDPNTIAVPLSDRCFHGVLADLSFVPLSKHAMRLVLNAWPCGGTQDVLLFVCLLLSLTRLPTPKALKDHVRQLLSLTQDVNHQGPQGLTPLMVVMFRPSIVQLLLENGARTQTRDIQGRTFLGRVLSVLPQVAPPELVRTLLVVCLRAEVPFLPWALPHGADHASQWAEALSLVHPSLREDRGVLHILKEAGFIPEDSLESRARCVISQALWQRMAADEEEGACKGSWGSLVDLLPLPPGMKRCMRHGDLTCYTDNNYL